MPNQIELEAPAAIAFQYTQQMREWLDLHNGSFSGNFCMYDSWTYGPVEVLVKNGKYHTLLFGKAGA